MRLQRATRTSSTAELLPGQRDVAACAIDLAAEGISRGRRALAPVACVGAPAVERPEPEHELSKFNGFVSSRRREPEAAGLVARRSAAVSMRIGCRAEADMAFAISSPEGPDISRSRTAMS